MFVEGDVFRIIVPLDDSYSFDFGQNGQANQSNQLNQSNQPQLYDDEIILLSLIKEYPDMTNHLIDGKIDSKILKPIAFDPCNNTYIGLGDVVGKAFVDGLKLK